MYQTTTGVNFRGGFYIKTPTKNSNSAIVNKVTSMTKDFKIYKNFNGNSDAMFVATPPRLDKSLQRIIDILALKYKYYPQIDPWMHNLKSESSLRNLLSRLVIKDEKIAETLKLLGTKQGNYSLSEHNGVKIVKNKLNNDTILISPESKNRTRYIKIFPGQSQSGATSQFFAVKNGEKQEFKTISEISQFNKKYNSTVFRTNIDC